MGAEFCYYGTHEVTVCTDHKVKRCGYGTSVPWNDNKKAHPGSGMRKRRPWRMRGGGDWNTDLNTYHGSLVIVREHSECPHHKYGYQPEERVTQAVPKLGSWDRVIIDWLPLPPIVENYVGEEEEDSLCTAAMSIANHDSTAKPKCDNPMDSGCVPLPGSYEPGFSEEFDAGPPACCTVTNVVTCVRMTADTSGPDTAPAGGRYRNPDGSIWVPGAPLPPDTPKTAPQPLAWDIPGSKTW